MTSLKYGKENEIKTPAEQGDQNSNYRKIKSGSSDKSNAHTQVYN